MEKFQIQNGQKWSLRGFDGGQWPQISNFSIETYRSHAIFNFLGGLGAEQCDNYAKSSNPPPPLLWILEMKSIYLIINHLISLKRQNKYWKFSARFARPYLLQSPLVNKIRYTALWMLFFNLIFITKSLEFFEKDKNNSQNILARFALPLIIKPG